MMIPEEKYQNFVSENMEEIYGFLQSVNMLFPVPLSEKNSIHYLAEKFCQNGTIATVKENGKIVSMVAGYTNNCKTGMAYISVVATLPEFSGRGHARTAVLDFVHRAYSDGMEAIHLYTVKSNYSAIKLYTSLGFNEYFLEDEPRKGDLHLIKYLR